VAPVQKTTNWVFAPTARGSLIDWGLF
jgi:hypothetical protein